MSKRSGTSRAAVERMFRENPHCHWCGQLTHLPDRRAERLAPNEATFDHFPTQMKDHVPGTPHRGVLACYRCNTSRHAPSFFAFRPMLDQLEVAS